MGNFLSEYKKPAISAVVFFVTLATLSYSYAAFTALSSVIAGQTLSKDAWNAMVANLDDLNGRSVPQGAVMAFFWTSCPTNWSPADGTANGVKKTDGTSGTLDLRGEFIRGLDAAWAGSRGVDPGRTVGTTQWATRIRELIDNYKNYSVWTLSVSAWNIESWMGNSVEWLKSSYATLNDNAYYYSTTSQQAWTGDNNAFAVRPRNVALLYCVKN